MTLLTAASPAWPTVTDDSGVGTDGTNLNAALFTAIRQSIEDLIHSAANTGVTPENIIDEVVTARGASANLNARLDTFIVSSANLELSGGLIVGFDGSPIADAIQIGDSSFRLDYDSGNPTIILGATGGDSYIVYTRATDTLTFVVDSIDEVAFTAAGVRITNGLVVGYAGVPTDDFINLGDANFGLEFSTTAPAHRFDANDFVRYTRATNLFEWVIGSTVELSLNASGLTVTNLLTAADGVLTGGLCVGFSGTPSGSSIDIFDTAFRLTGGSAAPQITWATDDFCNYVRASNYWAWWVGGTEKHRFGDDGYALAGGIVLGSVSTTPLANAILFTSERSDPSAPAANGAVLYTKDSGAGKTLLVVLFSSGAVQTIATEP